VFLSYEQTIQTVSAAWVSSSSSSSTNNNIDVSVRSHHHRRPQQQQQHHQHNKASSFGIYSSSSSSSPAPTITKTSLFYSSSSGRNDQNENSNNNSTSTSTTTTSILERLQVNGVSVSSKGFHLLMEASGGRGREPEPEPEHQRKELLERSDNNDNDDNRNKFDNDDEPQQKRDSTNTTDDDCSGAVSSARRVVPLKMTNDPADTYKATSPESLTLCQLLSGVDMAGAILPPELLGKIVAYHIEDKYYDNDDEEESGRDQDSTTTTNMLSSTEQKVREFIQEQQALLEEKYSSESSSSSSSSSSSLLSYKDAHPWLQSRIRLPQVTLDQLTLVPTTPTTTSTNDKDEDDDNNNNYNSNDGDGDEDDIRTTAQPSSTWLCRLECALPEWKDRLVVDIKPDLLASLAYNYDPESSPLFTCVALALRYKAPIVLKQHHQSSRGQLPKPKEEGNDESNQDALNNTTTDVGNIICGSSITATAYWSRDDLDRDFPQRLGLQSLQQQSTRVTENIERGFEIHKLTGALQIAKRLGDDAAAVKIRAKLDEYDSMNDLPMIQSTHSSNNNEQDDGGGATIHRLHDINDNNEDNKNNEGGDDGNDRLVDDLDKNILQ
jgi:hypothetical protein